MDVDEILKSPIFGFVTTILSIIIGIIVSHLYYRKGKQEGDKAAKEYRIQLEEAKLKILGLSKKLEESNRNLNSLIELANKHNIDTYDIMDVLKERSFNKINSDQEIVSHFLTFYEEGKIKAAENFLAAKINDIENELCRTYLEAYLKIHYKKYEEAVKLFKISSKMGSAEIGFYCYFNISVLYFKELSKPELALQYLIKASIIKPRNVSCLNLMASIYLDLKQYSLAKEKLDASLAVNPSYPDTFRFLTMFYLWTHNYDEAIIQGNKAIANGIPKSEIASFIGDAYYAKNDFDNAIENYKIVLNTKPNHELVLSNLLACYLAIGDLLAAERGCDLYLKHFPDRLEFIFDKYSMILLSQRKFEVIIQLSKKYNFFEDVEMHWASLNNVGFAYFNLNAYLKGKECFEAVLLIYPLNKSALVGMAHYYMFSSEKDLNKSLEYFEIILTKVDAKDVLVINDISRLFIMRKENQKAINFCNQALKIDANNLDTKKIIQSINQATISKS